jgi:hypothetical protein
MRAQGTFGLYPRRCCAPSLWSDSVAPAPCDDIVRQRSLGVRVPVLQLESLPILDREAQQAAWAMLTMRLVAEFSDRLPAGSVIRCVARCRESLSGMGVRDGLVLAVEGMARGVLLQRLPQNTG